MERHCIPHRAPSSGAARRWRRQAPALAGLLATAAALVSVACSGNHRPASPGGQAGLPVAQGTASWYGTKFAGRRTASGERYDPHTLTAAHPSLPFGTLVQVTNIENGRQVVVRVNDRGPFSHRRVIDVSYAAARELGMVGPGTARVELAVVPGNIPRSAPELVFQTASAVGAEGAEEAPGAERAGSGGAGRGDGTAGGAEQEASGSGAAGALTLPGAGLARSTPARSVLPPLPATEAGASAAEASLNLPRQAAPRGTVHYTVQVGAFGDAERAVAMQRDVAARYPEAAVHSDGIWHRVQVGLFAQREEAEALCRELLASGIEAFVVYQR